LTEIDDLVKTTTRGSLFLLLGQISSTLVLALGMLLVARFLGPSDYGSFNKAQSVVQIVFLLMNLGISSAMTRFIAQFRHENKQDYIQVYIETGILLSLTISTILTILLYLSSGYIANSLYQDPSQEILIKYLSISIIGQAFLALSTGIIIGYERMELRSLTQVLYGLAKSTISPILVYIGFGTLGAIIGHSAPIILSGTLGTLFIYLLYRKTKTNTRPITHTEAAKTILTYGFPLYLTIMLNGILPHIYTTLLGIYETNTQIGNYSVAINFTVLLSFVTMPIGTTIFPLFSKLTPKNPELEFLYRNAVKYSTLFAYPIIWTIIALADPIIQALYGNQYTQAANYLRLYILSRNLIGIGSICNQPLLNSQNRTDLTFKSTLIRFIAAAPLSLIAIRNYGVNGLILTFFTSMAINTTIDYYNIHRIYNYKINTGFLTKILTTSLITATTAYTITNILTLNPWIELIIGGTTSLTLYITGFIATKTLTKQDLNYIKQISSILGPLKIVINKIIDLLIKFT